MTIDENAQTCHVCDKPCSEPLQLTMDGEATCLPCIGAVLRLVTAARPEARDDGK